MLFIIFSTEIQVETEAPYVPNARTEPPSRFTESEDELVTRTVRERGSKLGRMVREVQAERKNQGLLINSAEGKFVNPMTIGNVTGVPAYALLN